MSGAKRVNPESLAISGYSAPRLRSQSEAVRMRRVGRLDKDGNVVGYTTLEETQKALLKLQQIEFDVADGVRPNKVLCVVCGVYFVWKKGSNHNARPKKCSSCKVVKCETCKSPLHADAHRVGQTRCLRCVYAERRAKAVAVARKCAHCETPLLRKKGRFLSGLCAACFRQRAQERAQKRTKEKQDGGSSK